MEPAGIDMEWRCRYIPSYILFAIQTFSPTFILMKWDSNSSPGIHAVRASGHPYKKKQGHDNRNGLKVLWFDSLD
jgi:hypothetical protein